MQIPPPGPRPEWAVLIYSSASPDLEAEAWASLQEVAGAAQPDQVVLGAQLGTAEGTLRYRMTGGEADELQLPPTQRLPPADMADPATLRDFLAWGMESFPAERYALVLGGHGAGFLGAVSDSGRARLMSPPQLAEALASSERPVDLLVLNSCLMAQAEVAVELATHHRALVASQGLEHGAGMPLGAWLEGLHERTTPQEAARALVEAGARTPARTPALSALDAAGLPALVEALDRLGRAILAHPDPMPRLRETIQAQPHFRTDRPGDRPLTDFKDLDTWIEGWQDDPALQATPLPEAGAQVRRALSRLVLEATASESLPPARGLSIYLPSEPLSDTHGAIGGRIESDYRRLALSRQTAWDEALTLLTGAAPPSHASASTPGREERPLDERPRHHG